MSRVGAEVAFVGRNHELGIGRRLLQQASDGAGGALLLRGEAGVGKTRLARELVAVGDDRGFKVVHGYCEEFSRGRPLRPFVDAISVDSLLPSSMGATGDDLVYQATSSLLDLLERLDKPVLLVIEDLHWADDTTLRVLGALSPRVARLPVAFMATARPSPRLRLLDRVLQLWIDNGATELTLPPLTEGEVADLTKAVTGAEPTAELQQYLVAAGGNPLYIIEVLRALEAEGMLDTAAGPLSSALPPALRVTLLRRISFLPDDTIELMKQAAVLGTSFTVDELATAVSSDPVGLAAPLTRAIESQLLEEPGDKLSFRHDLIREALYQDLPSGVRQALHLKVAENLISAGRSPVHVLDHLLHGARMAGAKILDWLLAAARAAPGSATRILGAALELVHAPDPRWSEVVAELSLALLREGRAGEAEALIRRALAQPLAPSAEARLRKRLAAALMYQAKNTEERAQYKAVLAWPELPDGERPHFVLGHALATMFTGDMRAAAAEARNALGLARAHRLDDVAAAALATEAAIESCQGHVQASVELIRQSLDAFGGVLADDWFYFDPEFAAAMVLIQADELDEAREALRRGLRHATTHGRISSAPPLHWNLAAVSYLAGQLDEAATEAETGLLLAQEMEQPAGSVAVLPHVIMARIALHHGDIDAAERAVAAAEQVVLEAGYSMGADWILAVKATIAEARGDLENATALLSNALQFLSVVPYPPTYRLVAPEVVRLHRAEDRSLCEDVVAHAEEGARRAAGVPSAEGVAARCRALLDMDPGLALEAVTAYRKGPRTLELAGALEDAASILLERHQRQAAAELLAEALSIWEASGATGDAGRTRTALRRAGRRGTRTRQPAHETGWQALTPTERDVVELVAEGLTNREIGERLYMSHRTVETHLSHVFSKTGLSTRTQVAAVAVRELGESTAPTSTGIQVPTAQVSDPPKEDAR